MPIANLRLRTSPNTSQPLSPEAHAKTFRVYFSFTLIGAYPTAGDPIDLTQLFNGTAAPPGFSLPAALPEKVELQSVKTPGAAALFLYQYVPGATLANGTVQTFTGAAAQSGLAELAAGNYPAGVLADTIEGEAIFPRL